MGPGCGSDARIGSAACPAASTSLKVRTGIRAARHLARSAGATGPATMTSAKGHALSSVGSSLAEQIAVPIPVCRWMYPTVSGPRVSYIGTMHTPVR